MKKIPCEDCILFATCNSLLGNEPTYTNLMMILYPKCSLLKKYVENSFEWLSTFDYHPYAVSEVVAFFIDTRSVKKPGES